MARLSPAMFVVLLVAATPAAGQVTIALDKKHYGVDAPVAATVTLPPGRRVARPRIHMILDGQPLPSTRSRGWMDFPEIVGTQEIKLRAPGTPGNWWLILNDADRLVGRVPIDVLDTLTLLTLQRDRLMAAGAHDSSSGTPKGSDPAAGSVAASPPAETSLSSPSHSQYGYLRLAEPRDVHPGERFVVIITLPSVLPDDGDVVLRWGDTASLSWSEKENTAESPGLPPGVRVPEPKTGAQPVTVTAPASAVGRVEVRLFRGRELLDALVVTVGR
jgi:hypothetical protein